MQQIFRKTRQMDTFYAIEARNYAFRKNKIFKRKT